MVGNVIASKIVSTEASASVYKCFSVGMNVTANVGLSLFEYCFWCGYQCECWYEGPHESRCNCEFECFLSLGGNDSVVVSMIMRSANCYTPECVIYKNSVDSC